MASTSRHPTRSTIRCARWASPCCRLWRGRQGDPAALEAIIRSAVARVDRNQPISFFTTLEASLASSLDAQRIVASLTAVFAGLALLLSAVGLYTVLAHAVSSRTPEIGIRMALGARPQQVVGLVFRDGLGLAGIGLGLGLAGAASVAQLIRTLLFEVHPLDPIVYVGFSILSRLWRRWRAWCRRPEPLESIRFAPSRPTSRDVPCAATVDHTGGLTGALPVHDSPLERNRPSGVGFRTFSRTTCVPRGSWYFQNGVNRRRVKLVGNSIVSTSRSSIVHLRRDHLILCAFASRAALHDETNALDGERHLVSQLFVQGNLAIGKWPSKFCSTRTGATGCRARTT